MLNGTTRTNAPDGALADGPLPAPWRLQATRWLGGQRGGLLLVGLLLGVSVVVACKTRNTYDTGDSIQHYLIARFAWQHPLNLLNAWGKPIFTLLAAGPAQAGFLGVKLFQCLLVALSAWLAYGVARRLNLPWPALVIVLCYAAPDYFRIQFSGLTEPLFGAFLMGAVALAMADRPVASAMLIGWLPLVRSEGILLWGLWGLYLLWNGYWRALPGMLLGYLVYSLVGGFALGDFFWLFNQNPYALHSQYGSGRGLVFLENFPTLLGWPTAILFVVGLACMVRRLFTRSLWGQRRFRAELLLIYGAVVVHTLTHSLLWQYGLFGSLGLLRVMTVLAPLCALIALRGLGWLAQASPSVAGRRWVLGAGTAAVLLMIFSHDHPVKLTDDGGELGLRANLHWRRDFRQQPDLILIDAGADWLRQYNPSWGWHPIGFEHIYVAQALSLDYFEPSKRALLTRDYKPYLDGVPVGSYVFWDSWFAPTEGRLPLEQLEADKRFRKLWHGSILDNDEGRDSRWRLSIFEKVQP